jgi:hypothetical protein
MSPALRFLSALCLDWLPDALYLDDIRYGVNRSEATLTILQISDTPRRMGRKQINHEQTPARFPDGTFARIDAVLAEGEKRSDFIRVAVEHEIARRTESTG